MYTHKARHPRLHPLTLAFRTTARERDYNHDCAYTLRNQQRTGLVLGALLWLGLGIQDPWLFPDSYSTVWLIRLLMGGVALLALASTFRRWWPRWSTRILVTLVTLSAMGTGLIMLYGGPDRVAYYHHGMFLTLIWAAFFSGLRFVFVAGFSIGILVCYAWLLIALGDVPVNDYVSTMLILPATATLCCFGAYLLESHRRQMFYANALLERDRQSKRRKALMDPLTGLPNRTYLEQRAREALVRARRQGTGVGLLFVDLDRFKPVNDSLGHQAGDEVLRELANRLSENVRYSDIVARVGGDEFIVLVEDLDNPDALDKLVQKLQHGISIPVALQQPNGGSLNTLNITASVGRSYFPRDGTTLEVLIHNADQSMYSSKGTGLQFACSDPQVE